MDSGRDDFRTIGIVGLGLMGASFAKAFKDADNAGTANCRVLGYNRTETSEIMAKMQGTIDDVLRPENLCECDLVIVCLYPKVSADYIENNKDNFKKGGLVIDACGTKRYICERIFPIAKEAGFTFVGCHPMAGNKYSGMTHSVGTMYVGAPIVVCPDHFDDPQLIDRVKEALAPVGFGKYCLAHPDEHDTMIAFTSQMPHLVSNAFIKSPNALQHNGFSAGSYRDMTRVAWLNAKMWTELFMENKDNLIFEVQNLIDELSKYKTAMETDDWAYLEKLLDDGRKRKEEVDG